MIMMKMITMMKYNDDDQNGSKITFHTRHLEVIPDGNDYDDHHYNDDDGRWY